MKAPPLRWRLPWERHWGGEGHTPESALMIAEWLGPDHATIKAWRTEPTRERAWAVVVAAREARHAAKQKEQDSA